MKLNEIENNVKLYLEYNLYTSLNEPFILSYDFVARMQLFAITYNLIEITVLCKSSTGQLVNKFHICNR
jgi:hypothetical protein